VNEDRPQRPPARAARHRRAIRRRNTLCDALNRILDTGAVVSGDLVISVADVDLLFVNLRVLLSSVETILEDQEIRSQMPPVPAPEDRPWSAIP
jgi:hypothetical protein